MSNLKCYQFELYIQTHKNSISDQSWQCLKPSRLNFKALLEYLPRPVIFAKGDNGIGHCPTFIKFFSYHMYWFKGSSQHKVGGEWFEIKLGKISRMLVKYEVLPIPNVIFVC